MESNRKSSALKRAGVSGLNKPKRTPSHPKKSHIVVTNCNNKAIFTKRIVDNEEQCLVGGEEYYIPVCRKHFHNN